MPFNHYAKMRAILDKQPDGWIIRRIDQPTSAKNFQGQVTHFEYFYRIYDAEGSPIKYCKFQQIDRLASILGVPVEALPLVD